MFKVEDSFNQYVNKQLIISYVRQDGSHAVLAVINNNDEHLDCEQLATLIESVSKSYAHLGEVILTTPYECVPDYITINTQD
jgi:hypothetical protein